MARIWGFDIGTTSVGWAVIEHEFARGDGRILGMGVRIFPEARDPDGTPLNQNRRHKRMARRQLRRRRERRKALNLALADAGLLPPFSKGTRIDGRFERSPWEEVMSLPPLPIRERALREPVELHEFGRVLYHVAKRRHFKGRDLEESDTLEPADADERAASKARERTIAELKSTGKTLGEMLAATPVHERSRGVHALRSHVADEFERLWATQATHHATLTDALKARIADVIFAQKPVFWRRSTLGECRLMPGEELAPKGSWLSQQRRMLEKLNNLEIATGNRRPLEAEERAAVLAKLQTQVSMGWGGVRSALKPLFVARGEKGMEKRIKFNLELGGEPKLLGNPLEARLAAIFGDEWESHPHRPEIRDAIHHRLWLADYGTIGTQRVVILPSEERTRRRAQAARSLIDDFGVSEAQADALAAIKLPTGWEPFSTKALRAILPELERGERFGTLMVSPERAKWREATFPNREAPTGEVLDRLPSPARRRLPNGRWDTSEEDRLKAIRNPTVARTQNELRKVVNNLIDVFGKPDLIRIELAREVGLSKREREERQTRIRKNTRRRAEAKKDLESKGILEPSASDIEKWVLWKEGLERCPYTGDQISFDALFRRGEFQVEHIWPRSRSLDDSQGNKTLCRKDINIEKSNRTPFEYFDSRPDEWEAVKRRMDEMTSTKGGPGYPRGKVKRFVAEALPDDFANRQLTDTGYAARQAVASLKRLWPDVGEPNEAMDFSGDEELRRRKVLPVAGKVTAQLRKRWGLNNILSDDGEKTRADHRHHAIDALVVACADPGVTQRLSNYWQQKDDPRAESPRLPPPWPSIRTDAERVIGGIVVSHRVRKKVSGPLHKETIYGDTGEDVTTSNGAYRKFVTRKKLESLSPSEIGDIRDAAIRSAVQEHVRSKGGDLKKAWDTFPRVGENGAEIRKARITLPMKFRAVVSVTTGYAATGSNHHIAFYRTAEGKVSGEVVSMFEASRRLANREVVVRKRSADGGALVMTLSQGDSFHIPTGERSGYWTVKTIAANGQVFCKPLTDADPGSKGQWGPSPGPLLKLNPRKVSIDPIGRVRPAND